MSKSILSHMMIMYISSTKGYFFMNDTVKIAVLGGDMRQYAVANELRSRGAEIYTYGISFGAFDKSDVKICEELSEAVEGASAVLLPLPATADGISLNCPALRSSDRITLDRIIELIRFPRI